MTIARVHASAGVCAKGFDFEIDRPPIHDPLYLVTWPYGHVGITIEGAIGCVDWEVASARRGARVVADVPGDPLPAHVFPILDKER